ncbi:hypothetical protein Hdeb2414_s0012g00384921 [Helianthus debilis subsp. tardiflorus]
MRVLKTSPFTMPGKKWTSVSRMVMCSKLVAMYFNHFEYTTISSKPLYPFYNYESCI